MPDTSGHTATRRDDVHTLTIRELEAQIIQAGIVMSRRQIMRHCKAGTFDAQKLPAVNNVEEWFIAPASVEKGIADIKTLQALRSRRDATRHDMSGTDAPAMTNTDNTDTSMSAPKSGESAKFTTGSLPATPRACQFSGCRRGGCSSCGFRKMQIARAIIFV